MTTPDTLTTYHTKETDALQSITSRGASVDEMTGNAAICRNGITVSLEDYKQLNGILGVRTSKLLAFSIAEFTKLNGYGKNKFINPVVCFSLAEYCEITGNQIKNSTQRKREIAARKIKTDLLTLQAARITTSGRNSFESVSIISRTKLKRGIIEIEFSRTIAEHLHKKPLATIPAELFKISGRNQNAYAIGYKIAMHSTNKQNIKFGTANRLKVKTLLSVSELPKYATVLKQRTSWKDRIQRPLEKALNDIQAAGLITSWKYGNKGRFNNYREFCETVIEFELPPD